METDDNTTSRTFYTFFTSAINPSLSIKGICKECGLQKYFLISYASQTQFIVSQNQLNPLLVVVRLAAVAVALYSSAIFVVVTCNEHSPKFCFAHSYVTRAFLVSVKQSSHRSGLTNLLLPSPSPKSYSM